MEGECPMCGSGAVQNQPITDDPAILDRLLEELEGRVKKLREGRISPEEVQREVPNLCGGCRGLLGGITGRASQEELIQRLMLHRRQIEARLEAMEQGLPPTAESQPRHTGPDDRAA